MKSKTLVAVMLSIAAVLVAVGVGLNWSSSRIPQQTPPTAGEQDAAANTRPSTQPTAKPTIKPSSKPDAAPKASEKSSKAPQVKATRPSWDPKPSTSSERLEMPETPVATPSALPSTKKREAVLATTPKTAVAEGKLTKGFPSEAMPLPKSAKVMESSVAKQSDLVMVGMQARSKQSVEQVLSFYEEHFNDLQWLTTTTNVEKGQTQLQAGYGTETATVTVHQLPTGWTQINAAGVFTTKK